jgi:hypothetical protein
MAQVVVMGAGIGGLPMAYEPVFEKYVMGAFGITKLKAKKKPVAETV